MGEIGDVSVTWKFANRGAVQSQVAHMCRNGQLDIALRVAPYNVEVD